MDIRHDRAKLRPPTRKPGTDTVVYEGVIARAHGMGDGLRYSDHIEYRDISEVRKIAETAPGTRVIVNHPERNPLIPTSGRLDPRTKQVVGKITSARLDGDQVVATIEVTHPSGVKAIESGLEELSLGYGVTRLDPQGYQRGIVLDHLALVQRGRCGDQCTIRTDCDDNPTCTCRAENSVSKTNAGNTMATKNTAAADHTDALRSLEAQRHDAETRATTAEGHATAETLRADTAEGRVMVLEQQIKDLQTQLAAGSTAVESEAISRESQRADAAEALVKSFDSTLNARVQARVALERKAAIVMGEDFRMDNLDDRQIMSVVVQRLDSAADVSNGVPEGIITGRFLALTERHDASARAIARVAEVGATSTRTDAAAEAKAKRRNAWKQPLPNAAKR